jgi:hypothetical protein
MPTASEVHLALLKLATNDIRERYRFWEESETTIPVVLVIDWADSLGRKFAEALADPEQLANMKAERDGGIRADVVGTMLEVMSAQDADRLFASVGITVDHAAQHNPGHVIAVVVAAGDVAAYQVALVSAK